MVGSGTGGLLPRIEGPEDFAAAFEVSRETVERLRIYAELLAKWQKTINLVAPSTLDEVWHRHMADSAQLLALPPPGAAKWVDLGSGAGFPGLVLAIMLADGGGSAAAAAGPGQPWPVSVTLIESDARKCAFLGEVVRKTGIGQLITVEIVNGRIENASTQARCGSPDVITARALASLDRLLELSAPLFGPETVGLYLKGRDGAAETDAAAVRWRFRTELVPSRTDETGRIVVLRGLEARTV